MCDILKTADRRAKRTKIWASGEVFTVYEVPLNVKCSSWGSSDAFPIFDDLISRKRLVLERNGPTFGHHGLV